MVLQIESYTWAEISKHNKIGDSWLVIDREVYDVSDWILKHPGGKQVISYYAGCDATEPFTALHRDHQLASKYLKPLRIGILAEESDITPLVKDFRDLRVELEAKGLFKPSLAFYVAHLIHVLFFEFLAFVVLWYFGNGWLSWLTAAILLTASHVQAGWLQHDFGHRAVFKEAYKNRIAQHFLIGFLKGASASWWNFRHNRHHSKTNVLKKDPDVNYPLMFLFSKYAAKLWGEKKKGFMPYKFQHLYWFFLGPPITTPIYFHVEILHFVITGKYFMELFIQVLFFVRYHLLFTELLGSGWALFKLYMFVRFLDSHWFLWATQMSHLPMPMEHDENRDWVTLHTQSTCDVEGSLFNDWFSGFLNYQVEHHLFPTMPQNNLPQAAPYVDALCKKHNIKFVKKTLWTAFADVYKALKESGEAYDKAYQKAE
eukprot:TRINITY_DN567_c0_g1_i1.p2 TRINITY_DN567_c0_g1~~TRINITY_DN567_c0_g1_i1.p2  ORF type:complete len:428 (+),score=160.72 TRINITY_DN567_c0_g1_i1:280-1563(+)